MHILYIISQINMVFPWIPTVIKYYHVNKSIYKYHIITLVVKVREKLSQ